MESPIQHFLGLNTLPHSYLEIAKRFFDPIARDVAHRYLKKNITQVIGINGCQGSGKSTLAGYLCAFLEENFNVQAISLSIDDFYLTKIERSHLSKNVHPKLAQRGLPGTHDIDLAIATVMNLTSGNKTSITRFDKSIDDRVPLEKTETVEGANSLIIIEGWCFGARAQNRAAMIKPHNLWEHQNDRDGIFRSYVNDSLRFSYQKFFALADKLIMLQAPSFESVFDWRLEQENKLRKKTITKDVNGEKLYVMNEQEIEQFIQPFRRITEYCLEEMPSRVDHLFELDDRRKITQYLKPNTNRL